jgi:TatD DNase family protein
MPTAASFLVDSHVHLQDPIFQPGLPGHLGQARAEGVGCFVCNGSAEEDWPLVSRLAADYGQIIPSFGLHPWYVGTRSRDWLAVLERCLEGMPSAVGEIGLDRWIEPRDEAIQEEVFLAQWRLACRLERPIMVHCLRAWGWLIRLLEGVSPPSGGFMLHAYGGSVELIRPLLDRGAYFSFAGTVLLERKAKAREAMKKVPLDRLLLETDAPDLLPPPRYGPYQLKGPDGQPCNHPANLAAIAGGVSEVLSMPLPQLRDQLFENSRRFLGSLIDQAISSGHATHDQHAET